MSWDFGIFLKALSIKRWNTAGQFFAPIGILFQVNWPSSVVIASFCFACSVQGIDENPKKRRISNNTSILQAPLSSRLFRVKGMNR